eukprot:Rmarinus@m.22681
MNAHPPSGSNSFPSSGPGQQGSGGAPSTVRAPLEATAAIQPSSQYYPGRLVVANDGRVSFMSSSTDGLVSGPLPQGATPPTQGNAGHNRRVYPQRYASDLSKFAQHRLGKSVLSRSKEEREVAWVSRPTTTQFSHPVSSFQDGGPSGCSSSGHAERLVNQGGYIRCLPARADPSVPPEVPSIPVEGRALSVRFDAVRPQCGPQGVHQTASSSGGAPTQSGGTLSDLSGRYLDCSQLGTAVQTSHGASGALASSTWFPGESGEMRARPFSTAGVPGASDRYASDDFRSSPRQDPGYTASGRDHEAFGVPGASYGQGSSFSHRQDRGSFSSGPTGSAFQSFSQRRPEQDTADGSSSLGEHGFPFQAFSTRTGLVERPVPGVQRPSIRPSSGDVSAVHGCEQFGVGGLSTVSYPHLLEYLRRMGPSAFEFLDKLSRDVRCALGDPQSSTPSAGSASSSVHGQRNDTGVSEQSRRAPSAPQLREESHPQGDGRQRVLPTGEVHSGSRERDGRPPVTPPSRHPVSNQLDPKRVPQSGSDVGASHGGRVRHGVHGSPSSVLLEQTRASIVGGQRSVQGLEPRSSVVIPTQEPNSQGGGEVTSGEGGGSDDDCSSVDGTVMDANSSAHCGEWTFSHLQSLVTRDSSRVQDIRAVSDYIGHGRFEAFELHNNSLVESSRKTYESKWRLWKQFCFDNNMFVFKADASVFPSLAKKFSKEEAAKWMRCLSVARIHATLALGVDKEKLDEISLAAMRRSACVGKTIRHSFSYDLAPVNSLLSSWGGGKNEALTIE